MKKLHNIGWEAYETSVYSAERCKTVDTLDGRIKFVGGCDNQYALNEAIRNRNVTAKEMRADGWEVVCGTLHTTHSTSVILEAYRGNRND